MGKNKEFGVWEVSDFGMYYDVGSCALEDTDIEDLEKALRELKRRKKIIKNKNAKKNKTKT